MDVHIRCICPPKGQAVRHAGGDTVTLRDTLGFRGVASLRWAIAAQKSQDPDATLGETFGMLTEQYVLAGVEAWTVVGDDGQPVEVTPQAIRSILLPQSDAAVIVADAADDLYLAVMLPLLVGSSNASQPTQTTEPTSAMTTGSERPLTPLKPFSTTTSPTDDTETTSTLPESDFRSLPNSESVA
jgi:hypothetical protein